MTETALLGVPPTARALRKWLRQAQGRHHTRPLGELLIDLYMVGWVVIVYGAAGAFEVRRFLTRSGEFAGLTDAQNWMVAAVLLTVGAVAWHGVRTLGPLVVGPAEQAWCLSTPVARRGWLLPRISALLGGGAVVGAVIAAVVALFTVQSGFGTAAALGAVMGVLGLGAGVVAQAAPQGARWPRLVGVGLGGAGLMGMAAVVVSQSVRVAFPAVGWGAAAWALAGLPVALVTVALAVTALGRLDRGALGRGAALAGAAATATTSLDPSHLTGVVAVRRWRKVGRVRSAPFRAWLLPRPALFARPWALLQAELRRQARRPVVFGIFAALAIAQYAMAVAMPGLATSTRLIGAYLVGIQLASGLRVVCRSRGLRRALGGKDLSVRAAHLVVPAAGIAFWWLATEGAGGAQADATTILIVPGIVAAVLRTATRPPMKYDSVPLDTPFGTIPWSLIAQLVRGPDLLALLILIRIVFAP